MKTGIVILKVSVAIELLCFMLYMALFGMGSDGLDSVDTEMLIAVFFTVTAVDFTLLLYGSANRIQTVFFWTLFVLYLLAFTMPAIAGCYYFYTFLSLG